jgi:SPP1 gp7 family putative phage head morphogenesis protein
MYRQYYDRFQHQAESGFGRKFDKIDNLQDFELVEKMKQNVSHFAAGKQQALTASLERILYNKDGTKVTKAEFDKAAEPILKQHNRYMKVEADAINKAASAAEEWQEIKRTAYLYPNLRYETVGDDRVRDEHWALDGLIRPINDDFWKTHFPPNGWGCRCTVIQTDDEPTKQPDLVPTPAKGFNQNVGETGKLIDEQHPYFNMDNATKDSIFKKAELTRAKDNRDKVKSIAKEKFVTGETKVNIANFAKPIDVSYSDIKSMVAHYHNDPAIKNNLIANLELIAPQMKFIKEAPNTDVAKPFVTKFLYYLYAFDGKEFFFNLQTMIEEGKEIVKFYAISSFIK